MDLMLDVIGVPVVYEYLDEKCSDFDQISLKWVKFFVGKILRLRPKKKLLQIL